MTRLWRVAREVSLPEFQAANGHSFEKDQRYFRERVRYPVAFLAFARQLSPSGIQLFTLQINVIACAFYEKNGFETARFGISHPPESEPDILYKWKP